MTTGQARSHPMLTSEQMARKLSLSLCTFSHALNGHPRVCERTRHRVMEAARENGFVANHAARLLVRARFKPKHSRLSQVGFLFLDDAGTTLGEDAGSSLGLWCLLLLRGAEHALHDMDASLTFVRVSKSSHWAKAERLTRSGCVDGWLVAGRVDDEAISHVKSWGRPWVILGNHSCSQKVTSVDLDHGDGSRLAIQHLTGLGHRRIAFLGGTMTHGYQNEMLQAYRKALRKFDLETNEQWIQTNLPTDRSQYEVVKRFFVRKPYPTAIFASEPGPILPVRDLLHGLDWKLPGNISFVGSEMNGGQTPGISRVEWPYEEAGSVGVGTLARMAGGRKTPLFTAVKPLLVAGRSSARISDI